MKITVARAVLTGTSVLLVAGAAWLATAQRTVGAEANNPPSWDRINRAATRASTGNMAAVEALADEVLAHHGIDQSMEPLRSTIKNRLVSAEIDYQEGKSEGLTEDKIVGTVNGLAKRFNAPVYAFTDNNEVKHIRLKMLTLYPNLMGRGPAATRDDSKPHFDKRMSPLEAFHTTATLVTQKVFNSDFQVTPEEKQKAAIQKAKGASPAQRNPPANTERTQEMLNVIHQGMASVSLNDMLDQANQCLDSLGIRR